MTTYAIGDLHGCLKPLERLLDKLRFNPANDQLWFVGDLINRGPSSLDTLRYVKSLGDSATTVLGNHDLHFLAVVHGYRKPSPKDTLNGILEAPDLTELCDWLASRPLMHTDTSLGHTLVHAGIHPLWSLKRAMKLANTVHEALIENRDLVLANMYGNSPDNWSKELRGHERNRFAINVLTRMRYCTADSALDFTFNGAPSKAPQHLRPWYALSNRKKLDTQIIFGHWSGHPAIGPPGVIPVDRGCVWKGSLTAYAIERKQSITVRCR